MLQPTTMDDYMDLVHEAIYELEETRLAIEDSAPEDDWDRYRPLMDPLDELLRELYEAMTGGQYRFPSATDLPFMPIVERLGDDVPLKGLLKLINQVHRNGL